MTSVGDPHSTSSSVGLFALLVVGAHKFLPQFLSDFIQTEPVISREEVSRTISIVDYNQLPWQFRFVSPDSWYTPNGTDNNQVCFPIMHIKRLAIFIFLLIFVLSSLAAKPRKKIGKFKGKVVKPLKKSQPYVGKAQPKQSPPKRFTTVSPSPVPIEPRNQQAVLKTVPIDSESSNDIEFQWNSSSINVVSIIYLLIFLAKTTALKLRNNRFLIEAGRITLDLILLPFRILKYLWWELPMKFFHGCAVVVCFTFRIPWNFVKWCWRKIFGNSVKYTRLRGKDDDVEDPPISPAQIGIPIGLDGKENSGNVGKMCPVIDSEDSEVQRKKEGEQRKRENELKKQLEDEKRRKREEEQRKREEEQRKREEEQRKREEEQRKREEEQRKRKEEEQKEREEIERKRKRAEEEEAERKRQEKKDLEDYMKSLNPSEEYLEKSASLQQKHEELINEIRLSEKAVKERENQNESTSSSENGNVSDDEFKEKLNQQKKQQDEEVKKIREERAEMERQLEEDLKRQDRLFLEHLTAFHALLQMKWRFEEKEKQFSDFLNIAKKPLIRVLNSYQLMEPAIKEKDEEEIEHEGKLFARKVLQAQNETENAFSTIKQLWVQHEDRIFLGIIIEALAKIIKQCDLIGNCLVDVLKSPNQKSLCSNLSVAVQDLNPHSIPTTSQLKKDAPTARAEDFVNIENIPTPYWYYNYFTNN